MFDSLVPFYRRGKTCELIGLVGIAADAWRPVRAQEKIFQNFFRSSLLSCRVAFQRRTHRIVAARPDRASTVLNRRKSRRAKINVKKITSQSPNRRPKKRKPPKTTPPNSIRLRRITTEKTKSRRISLNNAASEALALRRRLFDVALRPKVKWL